MAKRLLTVIDIGSAKICTVISNLEDEKASVIGVATAPSRGIKKGVVINIDEATDSIAECLEAAERMAGFTVDGAIISIGGKHIASTNNKGVVAVSKDEISAEDVARAIESAKAVSVPQSREILHVIPREFILDAQAGIKDPIGMSGIRLEVDTHIISATSSVMHNILKCVNQVGLQVQDTVFGGWVAAQAVLTSTEKELGVLLLDIGAGVTNISVFQDDSVYYSASVDLGGNNITSDLAIGLRLSLSDAERVKCEAGTLLKNAKVRADSARKKMHPESPAVQIDERKLVMDIADLGIDGTNMTEITKELFDEIVEARLEEIFQAVEDQLDSAGIPMKFPAGIVLTGGTAKLLGITRAAQKYMPGAIRVGIPTSLYGLSEEINGAPYAVVHGMIQYAVRHKINNREPGNINNTSNKIVDKVKSWVKSILP